MNPYKGTKKRWVHAASGNDAGSGPMPYTTRSGNLAFADSRLANAQGDINASSNAEWAEVVSALQKAIGQKQYKQEAPNQVEVQDRKRQLVEAAIADKDGAAWQALGEVIGDEVWETMGREAFAAKTLLHKPLARGEIGRIRVRKKDVIAFFATRQPEVVASQVRQHYIYPPEYYLVGRVLIEDAEIKNDVSLAA